MTKKSRCTVHNIAVFAMLGALMFAGKKLMEWIPNVHPLTMLIMVYTVVYRKKAIFPILVYLVLDTVVTGGFTWIVPYYYIFLLYWLITLMLPRRLPDVYAAILYSVVCALFGLAFGTLYAPWQALMYNLSFEKTITWIVAGLPWDSMHALGNLAASVLILPLVRLIRRVDRYANV